MAPIVVDNPGELVLGHVEASERGIAALPAEGLESVLDYESSGRRQTAAKALHLMVRGSHISGFVMRPDDGLSDVAIVSNGATRFLSPAEMQWLMHESAGRSILVDSNDEVEHLRERLAIEATEHMLAINKICGERDNWEQTAAHYLDGMHYYRGLVQEIGETIGEAAYLQDDGGKVDSVLCAKVPELVVELQRERDEAREAFIEARKHREQLNSLLASYHACWDEIRAALGEREQGDQTCNLDRVLKAIRERDEAREEIQRLRYDAQKEAEQHDRMVGELEKLYAEREAAK